jgi:hypothetical protein
VRAQVLAHKRASASACARASTCTTTCASTCATTRTCPHILVSNYWCSRNDLYKYACKYLREHRYLSTITRRQVFVGKYLPQGLADSSWPLVHHSYCAPHSELWLTRSGAKEPRARSQHHEAKIARPRPRGQDRGRPSMISRRQQGAQVLAQVLVQVLARAQVLAHKYLSASSCRQIVTLAQVLVQVRVQVLARAQLILHVRVGKYLSAKTCRNYLPTPRGLSFTTRTAFRIPSSGSQDGELGNHAREVNITKPR